MVEELKLLLIALIALIVVGLGSIGIVTWLFSKILTGWERSHKYWYNDAGENNAPKNWKSEGKGEFESEKELPMKDK